MNGYVKRMVTIVAAVFTLALVLAACGGSVDEGQVISFEGKDLNGNVVNSEELFGSHDVTMVNLWSSTCLWLSAGIVCKLLNLSVQVGNGLVLLGQLTFCGSQTLLSTSKLGVQVVNLALLLLNGCVQVSYLLVQVGNGLLRCSQLLVLSGKKQNRALFAALTAILGKVGIDGVESSLGTAIRTCVVLAASWGIVAWKGKLGLVRGIERRELAFLALSGLATGASWLCYYYALQTGVVSVVVQVDKLSIVASIAFAWLVLGERLSRKTSLGLLLIVVGTVAMTAFA